MSAVNAITSWKNFCEDYLNVRYHAFDYWYDHNCHNHPQVLITANTTVAKDHNCQQLSPSDQPQFSQLPLSEKKKFDLGNIDTGTKVKFSLTIFDLDSVFSKQCCYFTLLTCYNNILVAYTSTCNLRYMLRDQILPHFFARPSASRQFLLFLSKTETSKNEICW